MKKNFVVADAVGIELDKVYLDLHNYFELQSLEMDFSQKMVRISLVRVAGPLNLAAGDKLTLTFLGADYLGMSPGAIAQVSHEISELGYKEPLDFDHDWILSEDQASSADHFFLRLGGDEFIRLHSDAVIAKFEEFPQASNSCGA